MSVGRTVIPAKAGIQTVRAKFCIGCLLLSFAILVISNLIYAQYEPPEVIFELSSRSYISSANVGDQNDDGYDDLLLNYDIYRGPDIIQIYFGGDTMDDEPDWEFIPENDDENLSRAMCYVGRIDSLHTGVFCSVRTRRSENEEDHYWVIDFYYGDNELDEEIDLTMPGYVLDYNKCIEGWHSRNYDLNGDGYNDLMLQHFQDLYSDKLYLLLGSDEFDTEPDWSFDIPYEENIMSFTLSGGYDLNGDGYQDVLVKTGGGKGSHMYRLFTGGEELADTATLAYSQFPWEEDDDDYPKNMEYGYSMIPDINGDGYDDWAHHWADNDYHDGVLVFYGSDTPDLVSDIDCEGHNVGIGGTAYAQLAGGDFNSDGYGDIVTVHRGANDGDGQMNFYFGSEEMSGEADLEVNLTDNYGQTYSSIGTIGDYNGDGADDMVLYGTAGRETSKIVLAGWKNEAVALDPLPVTHDLQFTAYPNPFNSAVSINYTLPIASTVSFSIFNSLGERVDLIQTGIRSPGSHSLTWDASAVPSGVYFVRLDQGASATVQKLVLQK